MSGSRVSYGCIFCNIIIRYPHSPRITHCALSCSTYNDIWHMLREGITFDDVLLIPRKSRVFSRKEIDTTTRLSRNISLNTPLISANIDTVTESSMARAMADEGGIGIIHRFISIEQQAEEVRRVKRAESVIIDDPITVLLTTRYGRALRPQRKGSSARHRRQRVEKLVGILMNRDPYSRRMT